MNKSIETEQMYPPIKPDALHWFEKEALEKGTPVIDVQKLNTDEELKTFIAEIQHKKFFYVENHGIEEALIEEFLNVNRAFFSLSEEEKMIYAPPDMKVDKGGYIGFKTSSVAKISGTGNAADQLMKFIFSTYTNELNFPDKSFKTLSEAYAKKVADLSKTLLEKIFRGLSLTDADFEYTEEIRDLFIEKGFSQNMTILYPAVAQDEDAKERMASHFDTSLITLLYQIPALGNASEDPYIGFEVEEEGKRIPIPPVKGTFVINFGELIHHLTNGAIPATYHGVALPSEKQLPESERMTIVGFYFPDPKAKITISAIEGSISHHAIKNGDLKEGQSVDQTALRKAMFKHYAY